MAQISTVQTAGPTSLLLYESYANESSQMSFSSLAARIPLQSSRNFVYA